MQKVIIFGNKDMAELANYYLTMDAPYLVKGFTAHGAFMQESQLCGKPIIPFEELRKTHSPEEYKIFAPIYVGDMNRTKERICAEIKALGYEFISYISSKALTWNARIGENCFIFEGCNIQPFSTIGNNVTIWSFSHVGHHSSVGDNVFISGNVVIAGHNTISPYCVLGSNSTTREGSFLPEGTFLGQSASLVSQIDKPWGTWVGVPAKYLKSSLDANM